MDTLKHLDEYRLLFRGGKLWSKEGWRNVDEHQTAQIQAAGVLSRLLGLTDRDSEKLETVALVHDWRKRLDKFPQDFTEEDRINAEIWLTKINPDPDLMMATSPEFVLKYLEGKTSFLERIQCYLDDITKGQGIVRLDERIDEVSKRTPDMGSDASFVEKLKGKKFWDAERQMSHEIEKEIYDILIKKGVKLGSQEEVAILIANEVKHK